MLALCFMLLIAYYAENYAGIIDSSLVIEELITGNDGLVRAAKIRTAKERTNRPITKLVPLEVSSSDSETLRQPPPTEAPSSSDTEQNIDSTGKAVAEIKDIRNVWQL